MSVEFNKQIFFDNITYLLKSKDMKIGDLENHAGVSIGYVSRINRDDRNVKPSIEFVMKVAEFFEVNMETLVSIDLSKMTPTEKYILAFIEQ